MRIIILLASLFSPIFVYAAQTTLTWQDNNSTATNSQEEGTTIERNLNGGQFETIGSVKANVTTYIDNTLVVPPSVIAPAPPNKNTYCFQVKAFNHGNPVPPATIGPLQTSPVSNQACTEIVGLVTAAPIGVPEAPTNLTSSAAAAAARKPAPAATKKK